MAFFAKGRGLQKTLKSEQEFIYNLWWLVFPCCEASPVFEFSEIIGL